MTGTNLVLVTFDALRRDAVGVYGGPGDRLDLTPNLDRFADEAATFQDPYANGPATEHSFVSILTSKYTHETGFHNAEATFLPELLSAAGYRTAAFHSNPVLLPHNNFHRGFDRYPGTDSGSDDSDQPATEPGTDGSALDAVRSTALSGLQNLLHRNATVYSWAKGVQFALAPPYERAGRINERCFDYLADGGDEPQFLWVHYMDTHDPYLPDGEYLDLPFVPDVSAWEAARRNTRLNLVSSDDFDVDEIAEGTVEDLRALYHAQVRRVDDAFGELRDRLREEGLYEDSLVVVGSDHGEQFLEHGWIRHSRHVYDELLNVPLLVKPPAGEEFEPTVSGLASYVDLAPTFLDYAGVDVPADMRGRSLRNAMTTGRTDRDAVVGIRVFGEEGDRVAAIRTDDWKLIVDEDQGRTELYDLDRDPGETTNRIGEFPDVRAEMQARLRDTTDWEEWDPGEFGDDSDAVSADVRRRLQDLGYR